jgi:L-lactate dehydrogenase
VHAYVIGEHGDSEVLTWSAATIAGLSLDEFSRLQGVELTAAMKAEIDRDVRKAAPPIIAGKGATYYGIGAALARIVRVILHDQRGILTICTMSHGVLGHHDVTVSFPHLVGGAGMLCAIPPTRSTTPSGGPGGQRRRGARGDVGARGEELREAAV